MRRASSARTTAGAGPATSTVELRKRLLRSDTRVAELEARCAALQAEVARLDRQTCVCQAFWRDKIIADVMERHAAALDRKSASVRRLQRENAELLDRLTRRDGGPTPLDVVRVFDEAFELSRSAKVAEATVAARFGISERTVQRLRKAFEDELYRDMEG